MYSPIFIHVIVTIYSAQTTYNA
ncbi:hypothetical protein F0249_02725 [Vibrio sp. 03-59-1]|nr:hypothetical protein [Vibrio sp. 03-59-1]